MDAALLLDIAQMVSGLGTLAILLRLSSRAATPPPKIDLTPVVDRLAELDGLAARVALLCDKVEPVESNDDGLEAAAETALRHHHRPGPKDADGIRYCRCGDRYLDGVRL